ncbi:MAG: hypothetical protein J6R18_09505 [Kiritimatiellae bacterium]|nr:hypothetical protein [Kiritimatiellia bacterium]
MQADILEKTHMGVAILFSIALVAVLPAKEFIWNGGENGYWSDPESYMDGVEGGELPGKDDEVWIPANTTVKIDVQNKVSFDIFSNVLRIRPAEDSSVIVLDVPQGVTSVVNCAINKDSWIGANTGKFIKRGKGAVALMSSARFRKGDNNNGRDNYVNYDIEEGTLILPQYVTHNDYRGYYGHCKIDQGATLVIEGGSSVRTYIYGISGGGTIESLSKDSKILFCSGIYGEFSGRILSPIKWYSSGRVMLTGTESTMQGDFQHMNLHTPSDPENPLLRTSGVVGLAKIGMKGGVSSTGTGESLVCRDDAAAFIYLGRGETTDKNFLISDTAKGAAYLDAGAYGGIKWLGDWGAHSGSKPQNHRLVLTGSNVCECVFSGSLKAFEKNENIYDFIISKQGTGTWHFADTADNSSNRTFGGPINVEEGVFRFDSLEEKEVACSVGTASRYAITSAGVLPDSEAFAFRIGSGADAGKEAVLEYVGTNVRPVSAACSCNRKIGLDGRGTLSANGKWIGISGVSGAGTGNHTLVLDGTSTTHNAVSDISDGMGRVSVEKRGSGTWAMGRDLSFSGSLNVKEGKLLVRPADRYSWFRWTIKANTSTSTNGNESVVIAQELGFFNAQGYRQGVGLGTNSDVHVLKPGEVALDTCYGYDPNTSQSGVSRELFNLFDDFQGDPGWMIGLSDAPGKTSGGYRPRVSKPDSWLPVVVRMPAGSDTIASWDWSYTLNSSWTTYNRVPMIYTLEGSVDGLNWELLSDHSTFVEPAGRHMWRFSGTNCNENSASTPYLKDGVLQGEVISAPSTAAYSTLGNVTAISVAANASLVSDGAVIPLPAGITLTVDGAGNGSIEGFAIPENGTINLVNWDYESAFASFDFSRASFWKNLDGWNFTIDGSETSKYKVKVSENGFALLKPALKIVIR